MTSDEAHDDMGLAKTPPGYVSKYEQIINNMAKIRDIKTGKFTKQPKPVKK
jgi:hypothetical protein